MAHQAQRRRLSQARRAAFTEPPTRRNRVWQADFSQFEIGAEGTWQLGGVVDYVSKVVLACAVTATQTAADLCAALDAAEAEAQALLGRRLIEDCVDADTGEIVPIAVVTDNGPAMKSAAVARWFAHRRTSPTCGPGTDPRTPTASSSVGSRPSNTSASTARTSPTGTEQGT